MAANRFATMLARNTNKITLVLTYAMLEWILIVLLLLNSLFSYLIIKFADYFGLKRPCLWCSRLDHILEPTKTNNNSYRDLVCESHANEISKLGYCSNHRKLAESKDMCEDCASKPDCQEWSNKFAYFPWMKQIGVIQGVDDEKVTENREEDEELNCSCCGLSLNRDLYSPYIVIKPSWGVLDYTQKPNLTLEARGDDQIEEGDEESGRSVSDFAAERHGHEGKREDDADANSACSVCEFGCKEVVANGDEKVDRVLEQQEHIKDANLTDEQPQHLEFYIDQDDCRLVLVDMIDSPTSTENQGHQKYVVEEQGNSSCEDVIMDFSMCFEREDKPVVESWRCSEDLVSLLSSHESKEDAEVSVLDSRDLGEDVSSLVLQGGGDVAKEENELVADSTAAMEIGEIDLDVHQVCAADKDDVYMSDDGDEIDADEIDAEVSIGTDIPDQEPDEEIQSAQELLHSSLSALENPSTTTNVDVGDDRGSNQAEEELLEFHTLSVRMGDEAASNRFLLYSQVDEIEEAKVPNTPTSVDSLHQLHKGFPFFERRELGTEEPLDESAISDVEGAHGVLTVEKLKTALRAERKALNEVYLELEEERSASAVAASQTMAMINRLQEEKAAMQMEALQYQRMMDEQSEYDQEAMQLLNELMVKREKEKQELEKELEVCRKKIQEYEAKEKMMFLRRMKEGSTRSRTSSGACSNAEDSDGLSTDLNNESKEDDSICEHDDSSNQNTPTDAVLYLEESLASFEEEKLSILDQLKELEEKLLTLNDEEEEHYEDTKPIEHFSLENGNGYHEMVDVSSEVNGHSAEINGNHHQDRKSMAKRLLPLFDAMDSEGEDGTMNGISEGFDSVASQDLHMQFEEEVGHVYERLQALEADREFLKHCISSLRKGDKGLVLLQEILQHLRDLKSVEVRLRNSGEGVL